VSPDNYITLNDLLKQGWLISFIEMSPFWGPNRRIPFQVFFGNVIIKCNLLKVKNVKGGIRVGNSEIKIRGGLLK